MKSPTPQFSYIKATSWFSLLTLLWLLTLQLIPSTWIAWLVVAFLMCVLIVSAASDHARNGGG